jgi:hypothetical protein
LRGVEDSSMVVEDSGEEEDSRDKVGKLSLYLWYIGV